MNSTISIAWDSLKIRKLRQALSLTQCELAEELGCRQQTISEWELGMYAPKNAYQKLLNQYAESKGMTEELLHPVKATA